MSRRDEATVRREAEQGYGEAGARELRQREWASLRGERGEPAPTPKAFTRLVWRLQAKKYWAAKNPTSKARIRAYRVAWAKAHPERMREVYRKAHKKLRSKPGYRAAELTAKRAKHAAKAAARRAATVYTCHGPGCCAQWSPASGFRIPTTPPKYCSQACRSRANYQRGKAAGKAWAKRDKASRTDRRDA